jgi:hypothetical protein
MSTGEAARFIHTTEPRLAETVRRGKVCPEPELLAGRRLWGAGHLLQAATHLGILTDELRLHLEKEATHVAR